MDSKKVTDLVNELYRKRVDVIRRWDGSKDTEPLIQQESKQVLEDIIRHHILDGRDEKLGMLEAKVFMYEQMISKSTFAPMLQKKEPKPIEPYEREMLFTERQIHGLRSKVFEITGLGAVMDLFDELLCMPKNNENNKTEQ